MSGTLTLTTAAQVGHFLDQGCEFALLRAQGRYWLMFLAENEDYYAISFPQEDDPATPDPDGGEKSTIHGPVVEVESLTLPIIVLWREDDYTVDIYEPPTAGDIADALEGHRLGPFTAASGLCTCGKVFYGGSGLSGIPGDAGYRDHLGQLAVDQIHHVADITTIQLGQAITAALKNYANTTTLSPDPNAGFTLAPHQLARAVADILHQEGQ